jgi:DNA-binding CsgD family transcriptional regulator
LAELAVRRGRPDAADRVAEVAEQAEHTGELQWIAPVLELEMELALLQDRPRPVERIGWARDLVGRHVWEAEAYGARLTGWAAMSGVTLPWPRPMPPPHAAMVAGDWRGAAAAFDRVGWEYDAALLRSLLEDEPGLDQALEGARRLGAAPLEARVVRRLRALGFRVPRGPHRTTRANPAGLTPREAEVLGLLADGLTNEEIAARLQVSARTAEHHVSAVLAKLAVPSRRHAVRRAAELGILNRT